MLPLVLDVSETPVAVIGNDFAAMMRLQLLDQSGARRVTVYADTPSDDLLAAAGDRLVRRLPVLADFERNRYPIVYIGDFSRDQSQSLYDLAKRTGALVNVHDIKDLCDFHVPARLSRGDLQVTVSTNGRAAGLSRILRDHLADRVFGPDWAGRVSALSEARERWRSEGASFRQLVERTEAFVTHRNWLTAGSFRKNGGPEG